MLSYREKSNFKLLKTGSQFIFEILMRYIWDIWNFFVVFKEIFLMLKIEVLHFCRNQRKNIWKLADYYIIYWHFLIITGKNAFKIRAILEKYKWTIFDKTWSYYKLYLILFIHLFLNWTISFNVTKKWKHI